MSSSADGKGEAAPISIAHVQGVLSALAIELELNETETKTLMSQFKRTNGKLFLKLTKQDVVERMDKAGLDDVEISQAVCHKIQSFTSQHAGKRKPSSLSEGEKRKKQKDLFSETESDSDSDSRADTSTKKDATKGEDEATLDALAAEISKVPADEAKFCNPSEKLYLPFPFNGVPHDRFALTEIDRVSCFTYNGREKFKELHNKVEALSSKSYTTTLQLYGTIGYGKSHLLAAEAVLQMRLGKRVVYIPDCKEMLKSPVDYLKEALLLALKVKPLNSNPDAAYQELLECEGIHKCEMWKRKFISKGDLLFFIGQISAFDYPKDASSAHIDDAKACRRFLKNMSTCQLCVEESSASNAQAREGISSQSQTPRVNCYGGLTPTEYNASDAPNVLDKLNERHCEKVKDATGLIFLYLNAFITCLKKKVPAVVNATKGSITKDVFAAAWAAFVAGEGTREVGQIPLMLKIFEAQFDKSDVSEHFDLVMKMMLGIGIQSEPNPVLYDARFFVWGDRKGHCVCGLARDAMGQIIAQKKRTSMFYDQTYIRAACGSDNPVVKGFAAERACLGIFVEYGIRISPESYFKIKDWKYFETGGEANYLNDEKDSLVRLAIPAAFNYKSVDFVLRYVVPAKETKGFPMVPYASSRNKLAWRKAKTKNAKADGVIMAIQVTAYADVTKHYATTLAFFESHCEMWVGKLTSPVYVLVWIVRKNSKHGKDSVIDVNGRTVFQFFKTFSDMGLSAFDE